MILASTSPRRQELLSYITKDFEIISPDVDEKMKGNPSPREMVLELSRRKALAVFKEHPEDIVIGADTIVAEGSAILGKPKNKKDAQRMLRQLSGKIHFVYTGMTICSPTEVKTFVDRTAVEFYDLYEDDIIEYVNSGEPMDKAGAYAIQGMGSILVKRVEGDYYNIVGLPVGKLKRYLRKLAEGTKNEPVRQTLRNYLL